MSITLIAVFSSVGCLSLLGVAVLFIIRLKRKQSLHRTIKSQQEKQSSASSDIPRDEKIHHLRETVASLQHQLSSRRVVAAQLQDALQECQKQLGASSLHLYTKSSF